MARDHFDGGLLKTGQPSDVVIGVDPSLTGFAMTVLSLDEGVFESWTFKSNKRGIMRLVEIEEWMVAKFDLLFPHGFKVVDAAIEDGVVASYSAFVLGELASTVKRTFLREFSTKAEFPLRVPPTMVKKYATDRGNAKKNEILLGVYKSWGIEFSDDNMADSFVLAKIAEGNAETKYRQDVLEKLEDPKFRDTK